jgi:hypothetical protein
MTLQDLERNFPKIHLLLICHLCSDAGFNFCVEDPRKCKICDELVSEDLMIDVTMFQNSIKSFVVSHKGYQKIKNLNLDINWKL